MTIILDRGHGQNTLGKGSPYALSGVKPEYYLKEWLWADEISCRIASILRRKGYNPYILVPEKIDVPLSVRCDRANRIYAQDKDSFLVSIHVDAYGDGSKWEQPNGWSVWTTPGITKSDTLADFLVTEAAKTFVGKRIRSYSFQSLGRDFEASFKILKDVKCPAVLTENFFQTNIEDCKYILSDKGKEDIIKCHVNGIINYINQIKK